MSRETIESIDTTDYAKRKNDQLHTNTSDRHSNATALTNYIGISFELILVKFLLFNNYG